MVAVTLVPNNVPVRQSIKRVNDEGCPQNESNQPLVLKDEAPAARLVKWIWKMWKCLVTREHMSSDDYQATLDIFQRRR